MKPVLVDGENFDEISIEELEAVFGYPRKYTELRVFDATQVVDKLQKCGLPSEQLERYVLSNFKNSEISRTDRVKRMGQGFSVQAFVPLLKPLTHIFK